MNPSNIILNIDEEFDKILARKSDGIKLFTGQKLNEAIAEFEAAILDAKALEEKAKTTVSYEGNRAKHTQLVELISNCYNNISACNEKLGRKEECIDAATEAIQLKPNYEKALYRRARNYMEVKSYKQALDDYLDLLPSGGNQMLAEIPTELQSNIEKAADALIKDETNKIAKSISRTRRPIPHTRVSFWLSFTKDPILEEVNAFEDKSKAPDNAKEQSFDSVLRALKKEDFNLVYDIALAVMEDERQSLLDRIKAGLVAARFAYFHRLIERAIELIQRIPPLLEKFDKECDSDNVAKSKSLRVAYTTLMIEILPASSDIREMVENSLKIDPHNANPLIVLVHQLDSKSAHEVMAARIPEIDPTSPYAPHCELYKEFGAIVGKELSDAIPLTKELLERVHKIALDFSKKEWNCNKLARPPLFISAILIKLGMIAAMVGFWEILELATECAKKIQDCLPLADQVTCYGTLLHSMQAKATQTEMNQLAQDIESTFQRLLKIDPLDVSSHRTLAIAEIFTKGNPAGAYELVSKAIELVRDEEELEDNRFVRGRLVATIAKERNVTTNGALSQILHRIYTGARTGA